jgi:hypothetical protein
MNSDGKKTASGYGTRHSKSQMFANTVFIIIFIALIACPVIFSDKKGGGATMNELRFLATFPEYGFDVPVSKTLSGLEAWINDNAYGRNKAIRIDTILQYYLFGQSARKNTMIGKDDWMFYYTDEIIKDYQNVIPPSAEDLEKMKTNFIEISDECKRRGIKFIGVLVPDKKTVYPEYYPSSILKVGNASRSDMIVETLNSLSNLEYIYLRDALMDKKGEATIYSPRVDDAHWNSYGAFVGYRAIMERLAATDKSIAPLDYGDYDIEPFVNKGMFNGTVPVEEVGYDFKPKDTSEVYVDDPSYFDRFPQLTFSGDRAKYGHHSINPKKKSPKVLFIGDSYGEPLHEYFMRSSSEYTSIHIFDMPWIWSILDEINPDIVIYENVERQISLVNPHMPPPPLTSLPDKVVRFVKDIPGYNIDGINNGGYDSAGSGHDITINPNTVSTFIKGWAIDAAVGKSASNVVIKLGNELITARYGLSSDDVEQYFDKQMYMNCRFEAVLDTTKLLGEGEFTVYIVSADGQYVYEPMVYTIVSK